MSARTLLDDLGCDQIWSGKHLVQPQSPGLPSGFPALDAVLPGNGWPSEGLIEILSGHAGQGALSLLLPRLRQAPPGQCSLWIAPPMRPYGPALAAHGVPLECTYFLHPKELAASLWSARQALASGACAQVLLWLERGDGSALRRLHLAAEDGHTPLFLFRPACAARSPSPANLRLRILNAGEDFIEVEVLKRKGPPLSAPLHLDVQRLSSRHNPVPRPSTPPRTFQHVMPDALVRPVSAGPAPARLYPRLCS